MLLTFYQKCFNNWFGFDYEKMVYIKFTIYNLYIIRREKNLFTEEYSSQIVKEAGGISKIIDIC